MTNKIEAIHEACDYLAIANVLLRQASPKIIKGDPLKVRDDLINKLISIVVEYAQDGGNRMRASSFLAHPNLCLAFNYIHSFINSKIILDHLRVQSDYKICEILKINTMNFLSFANFLYPKLFSLGMEIY